MSSYLPALWTAIQARLEADTTLMALLPTGARITNGANFDEADLPVITFTTLPPTSNDAFRMSVDEILLDVHIYATRRAGDAAPVAQPYGGLYMCATACDRIAGDWHAQTFGTGPTYGLDRWRPDVSASGWNAAAMQVVSRGRNVEEDGPILHFVAEYKVLVSRSAV